MTGPGTADSSATGRTERTSCRPDAEGDDERWLAAPLEPGELILAEIADWGPAEDWSDWADAAR